MKETGSHTPSSRAGTSLLLLMLLAAALPAARAVARMIPVAQVSPEIAQAGVQRLTARHAIVMETIDGPGGLANHVLIYDSQGKEPPREVIPPDLLAFSASALWEGADGTLRVLVCGPISFISGRRDLLYSPDGGATWQFVMQGIGDWLRNFYTNQPSIKLGTPEVPFVFASSSGIWGIRADGTAIILVRALPNEFDLLLGSNIDGTKVLVARMRTNGSSAGVVGAVDLGGNFQSFFTSEGLPIGGWITPDGGAYVSCGWQLGPPYSYSVVFWDGGEVKKLTTGTSYMRPIVAPSHDFSGAWLAAWEPGATVLKFHSRSEGLIEQWRDPSAPWAVSLHAGSAGERVLIRTKLSRQGREVWGLALFEKGSVAPSSYDQVQLSDYGAPRGFVHLDVDGMARGEPFLIDTGRIDQVACAGWCPEFPKPLGIVRASLWQQLVIPAAARLPALGGAGWRTDLVIRNLEARPLVVTVQLLSNPDTSMRSTDATLSLEPHAIAVVPDALSTLFQLERGSGAIHLIPAGNGTIAATSRTYASSVSGTYGMAVDAVDHQTSAHATFPLTFSAGILGDGFRTNLVATDTSGDGSKLEVLLAGEGEPPRQLRARVPPNGQTQIDGLAARMGAEPSQSGSLCMTPRSGAALPVLIAIDEGTDDPSLFGPDLRAEGYGYLPVIVHSAGANGAATRTDLFLFNPDTIPRGIRLAAHGWDGTASSKKEASLTLAPGESRIVPDALFTLFGLTGAARLQAYSLRVRMTSRTYALNPDGSTYGMTVPPLGPLQTTTVGETLEILGPTGGPGLRTNLAIVDFGGYPPQPKATSHVEILDENGTLLDAFDVDIPSSGGFQISDLFRARGLGDGPNAAAIRVSPVTGWLAAYATTIDNGTNDASYFAGALGSH